MAGTPTRHVDIDRATGRRLIPAGSIAPLVNSTVGGPPLDLREVDLREANLAGADLQDAQLSRCRLTLADLSGAILRGARLVGADLTLADLRGADLQGADLHGADLSGADLREANLQGADLSDAELGFARITGARATPHALSEVTTAGGRVVGATGGTGEPLAAMRAFRRAAASHKGGRLGDAESHYREAIAWVPESDAARYGIACSSLERHDAEAALGWLLEAIACNPEADRARLEAAVLHLCADDQQAAAALLRATPRQCERARETANSALKCLESGDLEAAVTKLDEGLGGGPTIKWFHREKPANHGRRPTSTIAQLSDDAWVQTEREELRELIKDTKRPAWVWHGAIARAITIGAMDIAAVAEQRLTRTAPEHRLWGLQLRELDLTSHAFEALVRTRQVDAGEIRSIRWVAIGAHGPTARLDCEGGVFYAKRYNGLSRPPASVAFTHRMIRQMVAAGVEAPVALPDTQGDDVLVFSGDLLALYPDMGGVPLVDDDVTPDEARTIGTMLGQIHNAAGGIMTAGRPPAGLRIGTRVLRHQRPDAFFERVLASDRALAARFEHHPLKTRVMSLLRACGRRLAAVATRCPTAVVHGDFGPGNVLLRAAGGGAVIDWDLADVDLAVWDLARAIDRISVRWPQDFGAPTEIRGDVLRAALDGYTSQRELSSFERAALPVLTAASRVDLDCSVLAMCGPVEPDILDPILNRCINRLSRAAAGCPEIALELAVRT